jgi:hypothetical protein
MAMKYTAVEISNERRAEAFKWAREQFGRPKGEYGDLPWSEMKWFKVSIAKGARFYFRDPQHATLFLLRWA